MNSYIFESIEHGKKFPAKVFTTSIDQSSFHWHYEYELLLVLKGSLIVNDNMGPTLLKEGDIILIHSKAVHSLRKTQEENICLFIQLNQNLFENYEDIKRSYRFYLNSVKDELTPKKGYSHFVNLAAQIGKRANEQDFISFYRTKALLYSLVADLFEYVEYDIRQYADGAKEQEDSTTLMEIIEFIQSHYKEEDLSVNLCKTFGMSDKTIYRFLKNNIGLTVKDLIISAKIEYSKTLLKYSKKSINYIIDECGFHSNITFYRLFKKETGITPSEYRINDEVLDSNPQVKGYMDFSKKEAMLKMEELINNHNK